MTTEGARMSWGTVSEAAVHWGVSTRTVEARVKSESVPSYFDPHSRRRMVWLEALDPGEGALELVRDALRELRLEVAGLRKELRGQRIQTSEAMPKLNIGARRSQVSEDEDDATRITPKAPKAKTAPPEGAPPFEAILAAVKRHRDEGGSLADLDRAIGRSTGWVSALFKGKSRTNAKGAWSYWRRLEAVLKGEE